MAVTHNKAYVKSLNGQDNDIQNTLSGPFVESKFLSIKENWKSFTK